MRRPQESRALADFLRSAVIAPSTLVVDGEPGIGKLTLWLTGIDHPCVNGFRVVSALHDVVRANPGGGATGQFMVDSGPG
jgi:hypothetical protein